MPKEKQIWKYKSYWSEIQSIFEAFYLFELHSIFSLQNKSLKM